MNIGTQQNIVLAGAMIAIVLSLSSVAYSESLLPELEYIYEESWGEVTFVGVEYDDITCMSDSWVKAKMRCQVIIIMQNERIIDLLEQLVEK